MVAPAKTIRPYGLTLRFERAVAALACTNRKFWESIGAAVDFSLLSNPACQLAMQAVRAIAVEDGSSPTSAIIVLQRLKSWMSEGKVTFEQVRDVSDMFDAAEDAGLLPVDEVIKELRPILQKRLREEAVREAVAAYGNAGDLQKVVQLEERAQRIGQQVETSVGTILGVKSFAELSVWRKLEKLSLGVSELDQEFGGLVRGCEGVLLAGYGDGKCHRAGQGILMHDGRVVPVEKIRQGDRVMGPDGLPRNVLRTNSGRGEMFEIRPVRGKPWQVNIEHVLTLQGGGRFEGQVVDVSVREWLSWGARRQSYFKLFRPGAVDFGVPPAELPLDPYFLGVLLGDGTLGHKSRVGGDLRVTTADVEILGVLQDEAIRFGLRLTEHGSRGAAVAYALAGVCGKENPITFRLRGLGLWACGAGEKHVPQQYKTAARDARASLLAGLIDTDGARNRKGYDLVFKSSLLADDVAFIARSLGLTARVYACRRGCQTGAVGTYYRVSIFGDACHSLPVRIPRKRLVPRAGNRDPRRSGFTVVPTGNVEPYYGFSLDGDSRYLLDDFTVTHNSMGLSHIASCSLFRGLHVAWVTLELPKEVAIARVIANLTGVSIDEILYDESMEAQRRMGMLDGKIGRFVCHQMTARVTTAEDVIAWIKAVEVQAGGWPVDLVVVDYADKLTSASASARDNSYSVGELVYETLRLWAFDNRRFLWTASQAQRRKDKRKLIDGDDVADSLHKVRVADLVVSLNVLDGDMTYFVAKNRYGKDKFSVGPLPTDFAYGRICPVVHYVKGDDAELIDTETFFAAAQ